MGTYRKSQTVIARNRQRSKVLNRVDFFNHWVKPGSTVHYRAKPGAEPQRAVVLDQAYFCQGAAFVRLVGLGPVDINRVEIIAEEGHGR